MKIINREEFLKLKGEILYSRFEPDVFRGLEVKTDNWKDDWMYNDLIGNVDCDSSESFSEKCDKKEFDLNFDCGERDGLYEDRELFAIYSKEEILKLISRLKKVIN